MSLRRFFYEAGSIEVGKDVFITGDLFHHIHDVCRFDVDSKFELICGDGFAYLAQVVAIEKKRSRLAIKESRSLPSLAKPLITLYLSVPKFQTFESILEKSVELGVYKVQPFFSDRSFVRSEAKITDVKYLRWKKIILGALQQSGRSHKLILAPPVSLSYFFEKFNPNPRVHCLFAFEGACKKSLREHLRSLDQKNLDEIWLFVGSEGGFSEAEVQQFTRAGIEPLSLGDQVLRVETACVALTSIIKYELNSEE